MEICVELISDVRPVRTVLCFRGVNSCQFMVQFSVCANLKCSVHDGVTIASNQKKAMRQLMEHLFIFVVQRVLYVVYWLQRECGKYLNPKIKTLNVYKG